MVSDPTGLARRQGNLYRFALVSVGKDYQTIQGIQEGEATRDPKRQARVYIPEDSPNAGPSTNPKPKAALNMPKPADLFPAELHRHTSHGCWDARRA